MEHGRRIAYVDYHLAIPRQTHFIINPTGKLHHNYEDYLGGFILVQLPDVDKISLAQYTLELADKSKKAVQIERRYKKVKHQGQPRVSFWVRVLP